MTESEAQAAVNSIVTFRLNLLEGAPLICRRAEELQISVAELLGKIAYKGAKKKDSKRLYTSKPMRRRIYLEADGKCWHCHKPIAPEDFDVDHVVPHYWGGKTTEANGVATCPRCNRQRGNALNYTPKKKG